MNMNRRDFLQASVVISAGLTLGFYLPFGRDRLIPKAVAETLGAAFEPNAFIRIDTDNRVIVIAKHLEMGQGTYTGLATIVAEELDADWAQIQVEGAPADATRYNNLQWGPVQGTGASSSIANSWEQLRQAGATARAMLVNAAAEEWHVPVAELSVNNGLVRHHASGKQASFGQLSEKAARIPAPTTVKLKDPKDFRYIGKQAPRKDTKAKITGAAQFTIDVKLPDLLTAVVAHPPRFGAKVKRLDPNAAKRIPGVVDVVQIPNGVAVLAKHFWSAKRGRDALQIEWDESSAFKLSSADILSRYKELAQKPGKTVRTQGDAKKSLADAAKVIEAVFEFPYLAHAPMEPLNCVVKLGKDSCEIWNGEQLHTIDQVHVAAATGLKPEQVKINMLFAGGSFGRRASKDSDYVLEAVHIAKATKGGAAVKLIWTREDDTRAGYYRPLYLHTVKAGLDKHGLPVAWQHRIVGQSITQGTSFEKTSVKDGIDATSVEGAANLPYSIPNLQIELHTTNDFVKVPVLWWRSVGSTHTAYAIEVMMNRLALASGRDPVEFRRSLLAKHPRHLGVLNLAAEKAGWGSSLAKGKGRGIAVHESFNTFVAQVAEVTVNSDDGTFTVDRVVCAVDCGIAVNPDVIRAQMEGGIGYGLSAALHGEITLREGVVEQSNFNDYQPLRINEMPRIEVYIVPSPANPTGVGEPGVPPIAPAVANAITAATGKLIRQMPIRLDAAAT